jgi:tetratricopeptide (TPR) repeat protein
VTDHPRIEELRRRVQKDPASIAFAQLAEEYRRSGDFEEAVRVCRTGLAKHPSYLSARVTLGRALIELEQYDEAKTELDYVLKSAPENLAAIRGLAEIYQRRGELDEALKQYRTALSIAKHDPDIEQSLQDITRELGQSGAEVLPAAPSVPVPQATSAEAVLPPGAAAEGAAATESAGDADRPAGVQAEPVADLPIAAPPVATSSEAFELAAELEAAADEFSRALNALDSVTIELPAPPPLPEDASAPGNETPAEGDAHIVPAADWEVTGFKAAWEKRNEPAEAVASPATETTFDPVITFTDQTIAPVEATTSAQVEPVAEPTTAPPVTVPESTPPPPVAVPQPPVATVAAADPHADMVAELESFLEAILENQQEQEHTNP